MCVSGPHEVLVEVRLSARWETKGRSGSMKHFAIKHVLHQVMTAYYKAQQSHPWPWILVV